MKYLLKASLLVVAFIGALYHANAQEIAISHIPNISTQTAPLINIRYVDMDVITSKYVLAIEYQEWAILASDSVKNVLTAKYKEAKDFEDKCQKKLNNNKYASRPAYEKDLKRLETMYKEAQQLEQTLTTEFNAENARRMQQLQDSIMNYITRYNVACKYDAILLKSAGVIFNPALDITNEVVNGLNKRYEKTIEVEIPMPDEGLVPVKAEDNTITP